MAVSKHLLVLACAVLLTLGACTKTKHVRIVDETALAAAEAALADLRNSLAAAQAALAAGTDNRGEARRALAAVQEDLDDLQEELGSQPDSAAKTAIVQAVAAIETAVGEVNGALAADAGSASFVASLDSAQEALDGAHSALDDALERDDLSDAQRITLTQARGWLTAAQVSLIPQLEQLIPTAQERALRSAQTAFTTAQAATATARTALAAAQAALEKVEADFQATAAAWTADTTDTQKTTDRTAARTARAAAQTALATAEAAYATARAAERTGMTAAALATAAQAALAAATTDEQRAAATRALTEARAAEAALRPWATTRIAGDAGLAAAPAILGDAPEYVVEDLTVIDPVTTRPERKYPAVSVDDRPPFTVRVSLTPREGTTCTALMECSNPNALAIKTAATPWATGKTVLSPDATGDGDWFALRTISMRGDVRHSYEGTVGDSASNRPKVPVVQRATTIDGTAVTGSGITAYQRHYQNPMTSSIRFTPDGMVFRTGGQGTVMSLFKHDLDRSSSRGRDGVNQPGAWNVGGSDDCSGAYPAWCFDFNRSDAEASFGAPYADPDGEPNYYWASRYGLAGNQPQPDPADSDGQRLAAHGALGDLRTWVSNYGGLDAGAMADSASDDADRYLSYAAYGLFVFTDYIDEYPRPGFLQGYHFGYDAFRDVATARTDDVSTSIAATFEGRTMGMVLHPRSNSVASETAPHVGHFTRLRGDVTLNACIGAGSCTGDGIPTGSNRISGSIAQLQALENGVWQKYAFLRHAAAAHATHANIAIRLVEDDIEADGSYSGAADSWQAGQWNQGEYSGALYGPTDKLETAGWWRLETDSSYQNRHLVAFGSFGACQAEHCRVAAPSN